MHHIHNCVKVFLLFLLQSNDLMHHIHNGNYRFPPAILCAHVECLLDFQPYHTDTCNPLISLPCPNVTTVVSFRLCHRYNWSSFHLEIPFRIICYYYRSYNGIHRVHLLTKSNVSTGHIHTLLSFHPDIAFPHNFQMHHVYNVLLFLWYL